MVISADIFAVLLRYLRATSHVSLRLTEMSMTVNEVSPHLYKILTLTTVKTYLAADRRDATSLFDVQL